MSNRQLTGVIIVGGGAAGIMAALAARYQGAGVTILEKNPRIGKKLLATGNGRCNLTNIDLNIDNYHGMSPEFARSALSRFDVQKTIDFFEHLGIAHKVEDGGKVFPCSNQASSVLDVLRYGLEEAGVHVVCDAEVKDIKKKGREFTIYLSDGREYQAARVIIATGGKAAPQLGSNGSGLVLAKSFGHRIIEPFPALVQLKLGAKFLKQIKGIKFEGKVEIIARGKSVARAQGEILFTEYGISGPPVLSLSRTAGEYLQKKEKVWMKVVVIDEPAEADLGQYLTWRFTEKPEKTLVFSLVGLINKRLVPVLLREAGIEDLNKPAGQVTAAEHRKILKILKDWRFEITGTTSWPNAQVTAGGVDVKDINGRTLESKLVVGLYFAGEVLDIDGDCGGFNLQWAWSSGYVAGQSAAVGV